MTSTRWLYIDITLSKVKWLRWNELSSLLRSHFNLTSKLHRNFWPSVCLVYPFVVCLVRFPSLVVCWVHILLHWSLFLKLYKWIIMSSFSSLLLSSSYDLSLLPSFFQPILIFFLCDFHPHELVVIIFFLLCLFSSCCVYCRVIVHPCPIVSIPFLAPPCHVMYTSGF
jgi:hypothetical protein